MVQTQTRLRPSLLIEFGLLIGAVGLGWWLLSVAGGEWAARVRDLGLSDPRARSVDALVRESWIYFASGVTLIAIGRAMSLRRARDPLAIPVVIPAIVLLCLLGLVLHTATVVTGFRMEDGVRSQFLVPSSATSFAQGFFAGSALAAVIIGLRFDPATILARCQPAILVVIVGVFVALALVGTGPGLSGTKINLGSIQPLELVKPAFVAFLATYLGLRASKLRWQRRRILLARWPRPILMIPAVAALLATYAGLFVVHDLGPTLILAVVFLAMFYIATRASGWVVVALTLVALLLVALSAWPDLAGTGSVGTRIRMWHEPWANGLSHGHQLGEGLWAIGSGGAWGQGLAQAHTPLVPAGQTDLVLATGMEQIGFAGLAVYLALLAVVALGGLYIAAKNRTPTRILLAAGLSVLLVAQWAIIHAGTFGLLPLTGIVVPFLSSGRSSMVAFLCIVALLVRLAEDAPVRIATEELDELRHAVRGVAVATVIVFLVGFGVGADRALFHHEDMARGIVLRLGDGTLIHRQNPRLLELAAKIRRGTIEDRNGLPIAITRDPDHPAIREYPLGATMGTLVGVHPTRVRLPMWALERRWDSKLRGYGERKGGPRYQEFGLPGASLPLPWPDLRAFAALMELARAEREARMRQVDADIASRSVRLTIDARLQVEVATILRTRVRAIAGHAGAAVVLDVESGEILARAQYPDFDPADPTWQNQLLQEDDQTAARFWGVYGPGADKTGAIGIFQAGSVGKVLTALAAARSGWVVDGVACDLHTDQVFSCKLRDAQGPSFTLPGWTKPIHDYYKDRNHGNVDLIEALAVSCNVYFGQLALEIGPQPFVDLLQAGVDVGYGNDRIPFLPGEPGSRQLASTGFGQGATALNVVQAARLVAAIGAGGVYRTCAADIDKDTPCKEVRLVDDPRRLVPILAGMKRVMMKGGTGHGLPAVPGVRVYGKTGTADVHGFKGEESYGLAPGKKAAPHSWFVAIAEPESNPPCQSVAPHRLAIAVVVPRGGFGSRAAGPAAMEIVKVLSAKGYLADGL